MIWHPPFAGERHLGAFASGTANLRDTEVVTRRDLSPLLLARLALRVAGMPMHILSRRRWEHVIPRREIGYVLTIGVAAAVTGERSGVSGRDVLAELERWFVEHACRESWVDTELDNGRAINFYQRNGYREVSRAFGQVLLKKSLTPA